MVGSTWIDGPTLNRHNRHQGVILDVPQHRRYIARQLSRTDYTSRYNLTYQTLGVRSTDLGIDPRALIRAMCWGVRKSDGIPEHKIPEQTHESKGGEGTRNP
jgi:hypothetical protein